MNKALERGPKPYRSKLNFGLYVTEEGEFTSFKEHTMDITKGQIEGSCIFKHERTGKLFLSYDDAYAFDEQYAKECPDKDYGYFPEFDYFELDEIRPEDLPVEGRIWSSNGKFASARSEFIEDEEYEKAILITVRLK
jgi:hypothetical protein